MCGVVTYLLEQEEPARGSSSAEDTPAQYVQIMFSVPYNLNSYNSYLAVGVADIYPNITGLFNTVYYYTGPFTRATAGQMVEYEGEKSKQDFVHTALKRSSKLLVTQSRFAGTCMPTLTSQS